MNATKKTLTTLAAAVALAGGVAIAQTSGTSTDTPTQAGAAESTQSTTPSAGADTSTMSNSGSATTDSSTLSNSAPQADRG